MRIPAIPAWFERRTAGIALVLGWLVSALLCPSDSRASDAVVCFQTSAAAEKVKASQGVVPAPLIEQVTSMESVVLRIARQADAGSATQTRVMALRSDESVAAYQERFFRRLDATLPSVAAVWRESRQAFSAPGGTEYREAAFSGSPQGIPDAFLQGLSSRCALVALSRIAKNSSWAVARGANPDGVGLHLDRRLFHHPKHTRFSQVVILLERELQWALLGGKNASFVETPRKSPSLERLFLALLLREDHVPTVGEVENLAIELGLLEGPRAGLEARVESGLDRILLELGNRGQQAFDAFNRRNIDFAIMLASDLKREIPWIITVDDLSEGLSLVEGEIHELRDRAAAGSGGARLFESLGRLERIREKYAFFCEQRRQEILVSLEEGLRAGGGGSLVQLAPGMSLEDIGNLTELVDRRLKELAASSAAGGYGENPFLLRSFEGVEHFFRPEGGIPAVTAAKDTVFDEYPMPSSAAVDTAMLRR